MTAQHLRDLAQPRLAATVVATMLRLDTELTDAALLMTGSPDQVPSRG